MNKEYVWWSLVNTSNSFISQIKNRIECGKNIFLTCENLIPWENTFYELSRNALAEICSQKSLEFISAKNENDPGRFIMMKMCPQAVRTEYWPDMTYAQFLAQYDDLVLNSRIVWIRDIENDNLLEKWFEFIAEYCKLSEEHNHDHAVFVVEYSGKRSTKKPPSAINTIAFAPTYFDRYIFALSLLSELNTVFPMKQYIADFACCLCKEDTELCGCLVEAGLRLVQAPNVVVEEQLKTRRSNGDSFPVIENDYINSCILMAQIKIIFPEIEKFRLNFIKNNELLIKDKLPIINSFGEKIEEPSELELSDLCSISRMHLSGFSDVDKALLLRYRNYRNKLAHNNILYYQDIETILIS